MSLDPGFQLIAVD